MIGGGSGGVTARLDGSSAQGRAHVLVGMLSDGSGFVVEWHAKPLAKPPCTTAGGP